MSKWFTRIAGLVAATLVLLVLAGWWLLRGSLPQLDGEPAVRGLSAPVSVARDALGVVSIEAASEVDALRALGYVHAQERYFEMDLLRRTAAGELAELFGPRALEVDRRHRVHRMRSRVTQQLPAIAGDALAGLQAYADGVNAGLAALPRRPWPYLLLRQAPRPWRLEDSVLAGHAMYFDLQDARNRRELGLWQLRQHLPPPLFALLARDGSRWDAPLAGRPRGDASLPGPEQVDLRRLPHPPATGRDAIAARLPEDRDVGSNNFAVGGGLTSDGRAIIADDMHLGLRAPNLWFRARLRYADPRAPGGRVDVSGVTLPGLPLVVVGSNGHVAWGFTNSYADTADWKRVVRPCGGPASLPGCDATRSFRETIRVAGTDDALLEVVETRWGPIAQRLPDGSLLALRWAAHVPGALNLGLSAFARAGSLDEALAFAARTAIPTQNLVIGDASGRVAWRLLGPLPQRHPGCGAGSPSPAPAPATSPDDHAAATVAAPPCPPWTMRGDRAPALVDPPAQRLWTANNRVVDGAALRQAGDGGYALGARAMQIRDALFAGARFDERGLLAIQLDDRALFLQPWWRLLREQARSAGTPALQALAAASATRPERASTDSTSYRLVRAWRLAVHERLADGLAGPARAALGDDLEMPPLPQFEGVAWPLVTQRPAHLLPPRYAGWDALFEDAAREVRDALSGLGPLDARSWGERNTAAICHPLAGAIPLLGRRFLCMPADALAGDANMPRVAGPDFGASQRMVVSPGHEGDGILHMPGGQSGHPLSPFWGAGHDDWVHGRPTPFLPGPARYRMRLVPGTE